MTKYGAIFMAIADPKNSEKPIVLDDAIIESVEKLSEDDIARVINDMIKSEGGARFKAYLNTCMSCGYCSEACHYYLSHDNEPRLSPAAKVKQTLGEFVKKKGASAGKPWPRPVKYPLPTATCAAAA
jgi:Fe-S oxidoreductase